MSALLLVLCLCADPPLLTKPVPAAPPKTKITELPENFRTYFRRVDDFKDKTIKSIEDGIADLQIDIRNAPPNKQSVLKKELKRRETHLNETKANKAFAYLSWHARDSGDVGRLEKTQSVVARVVDATTVIIRNEGMYVVTPFDTSKLNAGQVILTDGFWKVTAMEAEDEKVVRSLAAVGYRRGGSSSCLVIEPVPTADMDQYEALYEAEKKANGGKPLGNTKKTAESEKSLGSFSLDLIRAGVKGNEEGRAAKKQPPLPPIK